MTMDTKTYTYSDPTGGGDDATLTIPVWAKAPGHITITDAEGLTDVWLLWEE